MRVPQPDRLERFPDENKSADPLESTRRFIPDIDFVSHERDGGLGLPAKIVLYIQRDDHLRCKVNELATPNVLVLEPIPASWTGGPSPEQISGIT